MVATDPFSDLDTLSSTAAPANANGTDPFVDLDQRPDQKQVLAAPEREQMNPALLYLDTAIRGAANSVPFMSDIAAAGDTGASYARQALASIPGLENVIGQPVQAGESFSQRYQENLAQQRAITEQDISQRPVTAIGAQVAGSLALPIGGGEAIASKLAGYTPETIAKMIGTGAVGAGYGALYGAGEGDTVSQRLENAETGAVFGGIAGSAAPVVTELGGTLIGKITDPLKGMLSPEGAASSKIVNALSQDATSAGRMAPEDVVAAQAAGQPIVVGDIGGEATRRLARSASNSSPEAAGAMKPELSDRFGEQADRFSDFMKGLFGSDLNNQGTLDAIRDKARSIVTPAYKAAYAKGANGLWDEDFASLIQSPDMSSAISDASRKAATSAVVNKSQIVKNPFVTDEAGNLTLGTNADGSKAIPTLEFWDHVKRALDDKVSSAYRAGNNDDAMLLGQLRNALRNKLDLSVPEYADARLGAFQKFQAENALEAGQNFLGLSNNMKIGEVKKAFSQMPDAQREIFGQGLASQIAQKALNSGERRNIVNLFNSPETAEKMQFALGPDRANQIEAFLRRENMMDLLRSKVMANSSTMEQAQDLGHQAGSLFGKAVANPAAGALSGAAYEFHDKGFDPVAMMKGAGVGALAGMFAQYGRYTNGKVMDAVGRKLMSSNPEDINQAVSIISKNPDMLNSLRKLDTSLAMGAARAGVGNADQSKEASPPAINRATGGKVGDGASKLMRLAEHAKRAETGQTESILKVPDEAVVKALDVAKQAI